MEKKQTAVEWLEARAKEREQNNGNQSSYWHLKELFKDFEQAKEMENSQKKEMYVKGLKNYDPTYLNEIYGGNNSEVTISNNKHECCTPEGQLPRYVDCVGCDEKPIEIMEKKQSSVEWYANASHELIVKKSNGEITEREFLTMHHNLFYDAEAMHKEEIQDAYRRGFTSDDIKLADDYYTETFGGGE